MLQVSGDMWKMQRSEEISVALISNFLQIALDKLQPDDKSLP